MWITGSKFRVPKRKHRSLDLWAFSLNILVVVFMEECLRSILLILMPEVFERMLWEVVKRIRCPILRWPGGNFASAYHWEGGIDLKEKRPPAP